MFRVEFCISGVAVGHVPNQVVMVVMRRPIIMRRCHDVIMRYFWRVAVRRSAVTVRGSEVRVHQAVIVRIVVVRVGVAMERIRVRGHVVVVAGVVIMSHQNIESVGVGIAIAVRSGRIVCMPPGRWRVRIPMKNIGAIAVRHRRIVGMKGYVNVGRTTE